MHRLFLITIIVLTLSVGVWANSGCLGLSDLGDGTKQIHLDHPPVSDPTGPGQVLVLQGKRGGKGKKRKFLRVAEVLRDGNFDPITDADGSHQLKALNFWGLTARNHELVAGRGDTTTVFYHHEGGFVPKSYWKGQSADVITPLLHGNGIETSHAARMLAMMQTFFSEAPTAYSDAVKFTGSLHRLKSFSGREHLKIASFTFDLPEHGVGPRLSSKEFHNLDFLVDAIATQWAEMKRANPGSLLVPIGRSGSGPLLAAINHKYPKLLDGQILLSPVHPTVKYEEGNQHMKELEAQGKRKVYWNALGLLDSLVGQMSWHKTKDPFNGTPTLVLFSREDAQCPPEVQEAFIKMAETNPRLYKVMTFEGTAHDLYGTAKTPGTRLSAEERARQTFDATFTFMHNIRNNRFTEGLELFPYGDRYNPAQRMHSVPESANEWERQQIMAIENTKERNVKLKKLEARIAHEAEQEAAAERRKRDAQVRKRNRWKGNKTSHAGDSVYIQEAREERTNRDPSPRYRVSRHRKKDRKNRNAPNVPMLSPGHRRPVLVKGEKGEEHKIVSEKSPYAHTSQEIAAIKAEELSDKKKTRAEGADMGKTFTTKAGPEVVEVEPGKAFATIGEANPGARKTLDDGKPVFLANVVPQDPSKKPAQRKAKVKKSDTNKDVPAQVQASARP